MIEGQRVLEVTVLVCDRFDFGLGEVAGAIGDLKTVLGGSVDEVGGGGKVVGEVFVFLNKVHHFGRGAVAVFADEAVDLGVFAKFFDGRGEHGELASSRDRHAGAVDRFVAQPGGLKFGGIEVAENAFRLAVELGEVDLHGESGGRLKGVLSGADVESARGEGAVGAGADYGLHVDDGQVLAVEAFRFVENAAERGVGFAHHTLHAISGADEVGFVDAFLTAGADKEILVSVGHPDHFVGHDLAD